MKKFDSFSYLVKMPEMLKYQNRKPSNQVLFSFKMIPDFFLIVFKYSLHFFHGIAFHINNHIDWDVNVMFVKTVLR